MRILLAMSALALVAVLWATVSISRHVYKSRRRARFLRERRPQSWADQVPASSPQIPLRPTAPTAADLSFAELAAKSLAAAPASPKPQIDAPQIKPISSAGRAVAPQSSSTGALGLIADARRISREMPQPQVHPSGPRPAFNLAPLAPHAAQAPVETPAALPPQVLAQLPPLQELIPALTIVEAAQPTTTAFSQLAANSFDDLPRKQPQAAEPIAAKAPEAPLAQPDPFLRRPVRSVHPQHSATPFSLPLRRPDWVYFNKDMGDLSDPSPSRVRDRVRSR